MGSVGLQQNNFFLPDLLDTVAIQWLDSDSVVTVVNCLQRGVYTAIGSSVTMLLAVIKGDYTVTVQSPCGHCVYGVGVLRWIYFPTWRDNILLNLFGSNIYILPLECCIHQLWYGIKGVICALREYCTPGPYFWRLCVFFLKNKASLEKLSNGSD